MKNLYSQSVMALCLLFFVSVFLGCGQSQNEKQQVNDEHKIGLLLVNHGSHSKTWREALLDLEASVKDSILEKGDIKGIKTAFMEYNEPSIATRLKEFDAEGYSDIIIVPIFLTVSPHSFDDIPTIIGQKEDPQSMEMLKLEKIERYTPKAKTHLAPLLDFTDIIKKNVLRRTQALSQNPEKEGLALIAYGDETYTKEWSALMDTLGQHIKTHVGIEDYTYGWCGHIARYRSDSTTVAINGILKQKEKAVVVPILVAHDENFQIRIIGGGISKVKDHKERVIYKPDAILPDPNVEAWVIDISSEMARSIKNPEVKS